MKKLLWIVIVILLSSILYFKYKNFVKYNPPTYFNYTVSDSIDINYYDQEAVKQYYENAYQIGSFARQVWADQGVDISFIGAENPTYRNAYLYYKSLITSTRVLEQKLAESKELKKNGYSNTDIKRFELEGISPQKIKQQQAFQNLLQLNKLKLGDMGQEVWLLQKQLILIGYDIPKDGLFGSETFIAVKELQKKNDLYPSGEMDIATIKALIK